LEIAIDRRARSRHDADIVGDLLVSRLQRLTLDRGRELRDRRTKHALREVVERKGKLLLPEVEIDAMNRGKRQLDLALDVVLRRHRVALAGHELSRQPDVESLADLCALSSKPAVVLPVSPHDEIRGLMHQRVDFAQDHPRSKNCVRHRRTLQVVRLNALGAEANTPTSSRMGRLRNRAALPDSAPPFYA